MTTDYVGRLQSLGIAMAAIGGVIVVDPAGGLVYANDEARRLIGRDLSPGMMLEQQVAQLGLRSAEGKPVPPAETPLGRALRGETVVDSLLSPAKPDGGEVYLSCTASPARDEQGKLMGALCIFRDATERVIVSKRQNQMAEMLRAANEQLVQSALAAHKSAEREEALRKDIQKEERERDKLLRMVQRLAEVSQRRAAELEAIIDNMGDGVLVCDAEGRINLVNDAGLRLMGLTNPELAERKLADFPPELRVRHRSGSPVLPEEAPLARALRGEVVAQDDEIIANLQTGRDVYIRVDAAPIRDEEGKIAGGVAVVRDLTELMELDRLKDQFIITAAHELKTPVTAIKGYAQLLLRSDAEGISPQASKVLRAINRQSDRISGLVNDLLDISRLMAGQLELTIERVNLPELVQEVVDRMALIATRHSIHIVKADPVVVKGDKERLGEVLANLIDNAVKFSPKGGSVDVAVAVTNGEAVVSVRDFGVGIPEEKQQRIFQSFYRAHAGTPHDFGGMGVGLFISKEIVTRHGGRIWFESEEDKGSRFYFSLPLGKTRRHSR